MPLSRPRRPWFAAVLQSIAMAGFVGSLALVADRPAQAQESPKPAKKDSRPAAKPKEVSFEVSVTPKTAKPGDVVTYSVTAKVNPEWHIYSYSKTQPEEGPRHTAFDFFDKAGLVAEGDWTPSVEPTQEKDAAFPDLPFVEYHENEVTWSQKLRVPKTAKPGKVVLRCQAGYQLCSHQSCSFPGQWTLPDGELTIEGEAAEPPLAASPTVDPAVKPAAAEGGARQPKAKDNRPNLRPKQATLFATLSTKEAKPGDVVTYSVTARLAPGWHIYKYSNEEIEAGPAFTKFDFFDLGGLTPVGDWTSSKPPIKKKDTAFPNLDILEFFEEEVTWSIQLKVSPDVMPGTTSLACQVTYQICDAKSCQRPTRWSMDPVSLNILSFGPGQVVQTPAVAATTKADPVVAASPVASAPVAEPVAAPSEEKVRNDGQKKADVGLLAFLLWSAGGGLAALVMPCVWPMIPITVNFFVKQGQKKGGRTTPLALAYCFAIIGIFTGMGVLFSAFFGASSIAKLANSPWLNFGVAALFIVFGLSLLGLFELRLPNFVLNASAQGESRGGLVGVMFMALTLTITSFTCTFPVVGALVVMAAGGDYFYPTVGLLTFSTVLALPFLLLALSPGLLSKMPRSGDWMNSVKVIGGLIEIGAAAKFINTAEVSLGTIPSDAWFNAPTVLAILVVLAAVCGIYLLGLFRTDHDHEEAKVGPGRILLGSAFLFLALYLTPALFGNPPHGPIYGRLIVGILPQDAGDLDLSHKFLVAGAKAGGATEGRVVKATSKDPKVAERQQTSFHGVIWGLSYEAAIEKARTENRPVLIDFTGVNCANCRLMEQNVLPRPEIVKLLDQFVTVQLYTDLVQLDSLSSEQKEALAEANLDRELALTGATTNPYYVILTPDGKVLGAKGGYYEPSEFQAFLNEGLKQFGGNTEVALGQ
jgi:thiol:disulfide interchange protein